MPNQSEKYKRKEILKALNQKEAASFQSALPITREQFEELFNYLDKQLEENNCDDTLRFTQEFLENKDILKFGELRAWLATNGAYCDCEVLANLEEKFEE